MQMNEAKKNSTDDALSLSSRDVSESAGHSNHAGNELPGESYSLRLNGTNSSTLSHDEEGLNITAFPVIINSYSSR